MGKAIVGLLLGAAIGAICVAVVPGLYEATMHRIHVMTAPTSTEMITEEELSKPAKRVVEKKEEIKLFDPITARSAPASEMPAIAINDPKKRTSPCWVEYESNLERGVYQVIKCEDGSKREVCIVNKPCPTPTPPRPHPAPRVQQKAAPTPPAAAAPIPAPARVEPTPPPPAIAAAPVIPPPPPAPAPPPPTPPAPAVVPMLNIILNFVNWHESFVPAFAEMRTNPVVGQDKLNAAIMNGLINGTVTPFQHQVARPDGIVYWLTWVTGAKQFKDYQPDYPIIVNGAASTIPPDFGEGKNNSIGIRSSLKEPEGLPLPLLQMGSVMIPIKEEKIFIGMQVQASLDRTRTSYVPLLTDLDSEIRRACFPNGQPIPHCRIFLNFVGPMPTPAPPAAPAPVRCPPNRRC